MRVVTINDCAFVGETLLKYAWRCKEAAYWAFEGFWSKTFDGLARLDDGVLPRDA